jgi:hypothetical protein
VGELTDYPDPPPVRTAHQADGTAQDPDGGALAATPAAELPRCEDDPTARRCIGSEPNVPVATLPEPTAKHEPGPRRWWENRDAGACGGSIPVYLPGQCDCNTKQVCGDGCATTRTGEWTIALFCVCGGLKETKRDASWNIPGFEERYPSKLCGGADGGR